MESNAAGPQGSEPKPAAGQPERLWREERPVETSVRPDASSSRGVQIFLLLSAILGVGGFIAGILSWLGREPSPTFLPLWVTEHHDRALPMVPMAQRDVHALRLGEYFSSSLGDPFTHQEGHGLVQDLGQLKTYRNDAGLVVYVRAHALRDSKGDVCILPADAAPTNAQTWLPLRKILESLRDSPTRNKLLVLDIMSPLNAPRLAALFHDIASAIPAELAAVPDPSRLVLCSCSPGQMSFDSEELGRSIFSYYFEEGLKGYAEGYAARRPDTQVSALELANFVRARVDRWALHNRGFRQTPILYGTGQDFPLLALDHGEPRKHEPELIELVYPPWLTEAWKLRDAWVRDGSFRLAPRPFMQAQALLLQTEWNWCCSVKTLLEGEGTPAEHLQNRFQSTFDGFRRRIERARNLVQPVTMSLAQQLPAGSPDPKLTKTLQDWLLHYPRQLALAKPEEVAPLRAKMLDELRDKTKDFSATALEHGVFHLALQDTRHDQSTLRLLEQVLQRPGQPLSPTVEIHVLGQLAELAGRLEPSAWPADVAGRLLDVTHKAELATSDARVFAWVRPWLDEAIPFRHEGEVRLWARGYAPIEEADRLLKLAGQNYQGALQQGAKVRDGINALTDAYAVLPFMPLYLDANPMLQKAWELSVRDAVELAELLRTLPPREGDEQQKSQYLFQVGKRIVDINKVATSLRGRLHELEKPFAPEQLQRILKVSKQPQADAKFYVQMAALMRVPHPALSAEDRVVLCKATQNLAKRLLDDTLERDREDNARMQATQAPEPWDEDQAHLHEQSRARDRGRRLVGLLELSGLERATLQPALAALQKASQEPTSENWSRTSSVLRTAWLQQLPAQYQAEENPVRREQMAWLLSPLENYRVIDEAEMSPTTQVRWQQAQAMWTWISDHMRFRARDFQGLGLDSPALAASARFYARAALANQDFVRLPLEAYVTMRTPGPPPDITADRPASQVDLLVQRFMPEDAPGAVDLTFLRPDNAWLLVSPAEVSLPPVPDAGNAPRTISNNVPVQIALKPGAQRSQTPRPDGILVQARLNGKPFHRLVNVPLASLTQELQLLVSANPKEPDPPLQELRLRPGKVQQSFFLYLKNLTNKARKTSVEVAGPDGVIAVAAVVVGPMETQPVRLESKTPPTVAPMVTLMKDEKAPPPPTPTLPELQGPLEIRVRDADTPTTILISSKLRVAIGSPREYVNVTDIRFDPAGPKGEGNKLAVKLQALAKVPGPPIPADLVFPARRIPGFLGTGGGTFHGEIPNKDKLTPITLFAEKIAMAPGSDDEGPVHVNIDGVERSFIFRASLGRSKEPSVPRGDGRPAIRVVAEPFAQALTNFLVPIETDNAPNGATVEIAVGRLVQGEFEADSVRRFPDSRQRIIGCAVQKGALVFEAQVRDWVATFDTTRILGQRILRARLLDEVDNELLQSQQNILIDSNAPSLVRFVDPPPRVKRGTTINLKAQAQDSESGVAQAVFFFGKPQDGKIPPNVQTIAAAPVDGSQTVWGAQVPLPADVKGPLPISVQFVNRVGLTTFETTTIELTENEPGFTGLGKIQGKVSEGPRPQPGLEVILRDEKGKELTRTKSAGDGGFVFDKLKPGRYSVFVRKPDSQRSATIAVTVQADKTTPAALSLSL